MNVAACFALLALLSRLAVQALEEDPEGDVVLLRGEAVIHM